MARVKAVAKFLLYLQEIDPSVQDVSNLKLQKLLYYCQASSIQLNNELLFVDAEFEAWQYGPVVPEIYKEYNTYGNKPIRVDLTDHISQELLETLSEQEIEAILFAWKAYSHKTAGELVELSHSEAPWYNAWSNGRRNIHIGDMFTTFANEYA